MTRRRITLSLALAILAWSSRLLAQQEEAPGASMKRLAAMRATAPIVIDGRLDEPAWAQAAIIAADDIHQILPVEYSAPSQVTRFLVLYDDDALYLAADMKDDRPELMTAKVLRQGGANSWLDDQFNIFLDPFNDKRGGYRFQVNPHGVRQEGLFRGADQVQWQWNGIWQAGAQQGVDGWIAETRIPFKTISFDPETDSWGLNFNRRVARTNETMGWVSRNRSQSPAISGELTGISGLQQGLGLDVVPSMTIVERRDFSPRGDTSDAEPSLDVFYKVTPSLNAALTLNTDFSATEVDDRQVNLTRFGLFFPERRDFFLQDADIFEFGRIGQRAMDSPFARPLEENALPFFSRRIGLSATGQPVDLEGGAKLSGRAGRWTIGTLAIRQDEFQAVAPSSLFVGRVAANVLAESAVGLIVTDGDPLSNVDNSVAGVDFRYQNTRLPNGRTLESEAWYQQSSTDGREGNDAAWGIRAWSPNTAGFRGGVGIKQVEANFNPALGLSQPSRHPGLFGRARLHLSSLRKRLAYAVLRRQRSAYRESRRRLAERSVATACRAREPDLRQADLPAAKPEGGSRPAVRDLPRHRHPSTHRSVFVRPDASRDQHGSAPTLRDDCGVRNG